MSISNVLQKHWWFHLKIPHLYSKVLKGANNSNGGVSSAHLRWQRAYFGAEYLLKYWSVIRAQCVCECVSDRTRCYISITPSLRTSHLMISWLEIPLPPKQTTDQPPSFPQYTHTHNLADWLVLAAIFGEYPRPVYESDTTHHRRCLTLAEGAEALNLFFSHLRVKGNDVYFHVQPLLAYSTAYLLASIPILLQKIESRALYFITN